MNKKLKQLSLRFPDLLSTYKTNWSPEPFDFLLQEEKTVIDIDTTESLSKNKEQILEKVKVANENGYIVIRILDTDQSVFDKLVLKQVNQFICQNNEYNELIYGLLEKKVDVKVVKSLNNYSNKNLGELKDIARLLGIPKVYTYNKETRDDLIKLIFEKENQKILSK